MPSLSKQDKIDLLADLHSAERRKDFEEMSMRTSSLTPAEWIDFLDQTTKLFKNIGDKKTIIRGNNFLL